ncbi:acetyltransferase (GNAT) family protein [Promicromonospora sp. AC04]|uniref:GNAT family N-acetyltransferase n=1 Tax=Promicromonospora sp. AC04 TaxID=2135723 RepID=UPI000D385A8E|nr:GNAT family N-acetyltransferase [Promicromonospora sp. AC04]PUB25300.1 acetyltransferase (GNAT) family protein [Promicromonospora sp. AC04]
MTATTGTSTETSPALEVREVHLSDPLVEPLLAGLSVEYRSRYHDLLTEEQHRAEMAHYAAEEFAPPVGSLVLLLEDGEPVAGGAFRRRLEPELGEAARLARADVRDVDGVPVIPTAELKRIWTHAAHRRRGLARRVLAELEARARDLGYPRLYLTTGPRQPEAAALYRSTGYTPLSAAAAGDSDPAGEQPFSPLPFEKWLAP